jgi:hypothetical protein
LEESGLRHTPHAVDFCSSPRTLWVLTSSSTTSPVSRRYDQAVVDDALLDHGPVAVDLDHRDPLDVGGFCGSLERDTLVEVGPGLGDDRIELGAGGEVAQCWIVGFGVPLFAAKRAFQ